MQRAAGHRMDTAELVDTYLSSRNAPVAAATRRTTGATNATQLVRTVEGVRPIEPSPTLKLRNCESKPEPLSSRSMRWLSEFWMAIDGMFIGASGAAGKKPPMCENYGHIYHDSWEKGYPNCADCGCRITDSIMLRSAHVREVEKSGTDNPKKKK
jgi:hypothetical protein